MNNIRMNHETKQLFKRLGRVNIKRYDENLYLYKYVTIETAKKILATGTLKFSSPIELKDNDCEMCLLDFECNAEVIYKHKRKTIIKAYENLGYNRNHIYEILSTPEGKETIKLVTDKQVLDIIYESYEQQKGKVGLFSSTISNELPEMWDKYAENGTGVCIQYKFPTLLNKGFYTLTVAYDADMSPVKIFDKKGEILGYPIHRWMFTKRTRYAFEQEVRLVSNYSAVGISNPLNEVFSGVFYGKQTSQNSIDEIDTIIKNAGYSFDKGERITF